MSTPFPLDNPAMLTSDLPDFSCQNYRVEKELGHNRAGGRVTYLATDIRTDQSVVIKQFQFAKTGATWASYDTYDREIQILKELNHPGIPQYLESFQTDDGFCMVQEYKEAESLATFRSFNPDEIKQIAVSVLEVLVYLQNRIPPIIHRDLKPENILVSKTGTVYLVDFGFARIGQGEVGVSSVVKGTLGFMPPEQLFNRQLTEASDLYGLGMTLICLLTGTNSDQIGELVDISYRISFKHLVPKLNMQWVSWLEKMVESRLKDRFPNAVEALAAIPATPLRPPEAQFSQSNLEFRATKRYEQLTQAIVIKNPIPETVLEGEWEIVPHPHDPPAEVYGWISIEPKTFIDNQVECFVSVDVSKLMTGKTYHRKVLLHTNTLAKAYPLSLHIQTIPNPAESALLPYGVVLLLCLFSSGISWLFACLVLVVSTAAEARGIAGFGALIGAGIGLELSAWLMRSSGWQTGATTSTVAAIAVGTIGLINVLVGTNTTTSSVIIFGAGAGLLEGAIAGVALGTAVEQLLARGCSKGLAIGVSLLASSLGTSLGIGLTNGFGNPLVMALLVSSGLLLIILIVHLQLHRMSHRFSHRKSERHLIKP